VKTTSPESKSHSNLCHRSTVTGSLTGATEKDMVQFQECDDRDLKKHSMVVNERTCTWNKQTLINDERVCPLKWID